MAQTAHTPGPWRKTFNAAKERGVRNEGGFICFLPKPNHYTGQDERYEQELAENAANAALIAAAPDLLEALQQVCEAMGWSDKSIVTLGGIQYVENALAAIAKATNTELSK